MERILYQRYQVSISWSIVQNNREIDRMSYIRFKLGRQSGETPKRLFVITKYLKKFKGKFYQTVIRTIILYASKC